MKRIEQGWNRTAGAVKRAIEWVGRHEASVLAALLAMIVASWAFAELADDVMEGETQKFDEWAIRALRRADDPATPIGPRWMHEVGRDLTALGGITMLSLT